MKRCDVQQLLSELQRGVPLYDVRTPAEFEHAHIPGASNLPLFDNEERAVVGTTYKQVGRHEAIKVGLEMIGPRMRELVERVEADVGPPSDDARVFVHCWRGGMRSQSVGWLLGMYGYKVTTLVGGYKSFRRWVLERLDAPPPLLVLGGRTGSGKTLLLDELNDRGESVIDLEGLANHRGSSFGALNLPPQPSQEQFEALVALELERVGDALTWVEDESSMIGTCQVPTTMKNRMREAPVVVLDVPLEERVAVLVEIYGDAARDELIASFKRIEKRLGGERTREAVEAVEAGDLAAAAEIGLYYYDRAYDYGLSKREPETLHRIEVADREGLAGRALEVAQQIAERRM